MLQQNTQIPNFEEDYQLYYITFYLKKISNFKISSLK